MKMALTVVVVLAIGSGLAQAAELTWSGPAGGDWFDGANWTGGSGNYPQATDTVTIPSGASVLLTNATDDLAAFSITNATLTFSNWTACLRATEINIRNNGNLTHAAINTNAVPGVTNRVYLVGSNVTVHTGGTINVTAQGHRGGINDGEAGQGPGGGGVFIQGANRFSGGGGYGGAGGFGTLSSNGSPGPAYGQPGAPLEPGSGAGRGRMSPTTTAAAWW